MYACDYGKKGKLKFYNEEGKWEFPEHILRGSTPGDRNIERFAYILARDDLTTEASTTHCSGVNPVELLKVVENSPHRLYIIPNRAVPNLLGRTRVDDELAAKTIYQIATDGKTFKKTWKGTGGIQRAKLSPRPDDQDKYRSLGVRQMIDKYFPLFDDISDDDIEYAFGNGNKFRNRDWNMSRIYPMAWAREEMELQGLTGRKAFENIIGDYGHGYPSWYRRAVLYVGNAICKRMWGVPMSRSGPHRNKPKASDEQRSAAWHATRPIIRRLYQISVAWRNSTLEAA